MIVEWFEWFGKSPRFNPGDDVYVVYDSEVRNNLCSIEKTKIRTVPASWWTEESKQYLVWSGYYEINIMRRESEYISPWWCSDDYVFASLEEAKTSAKWIPVDLSDEQWLAIAGDREVDEDSPGCLEECELGVDGQSISIVRDFLYEIKKHKGISEVKRKKLQNILMYSRCPDALDNSDSLLNSLLKQLNLQWRSE